MHERLASSPSCFKFRIFTLTLVSAIVSPVYVVNSKLFLFQHFFCPIIFTEFSRPFFTIIHYLSRNYLAYNHKISKFIPFMKDLAVFPPLFHFGGFPACFCFGIFHIVFKGYFLGHRPILAIGVFKHANFFVN